MPKAYHKSTRNENMKSNIQLMSNSWNQLTMIYNKAARLTNRLEKKQEEKQAVKQAGITGAHKAL